MEGEIMKKFWKLLQVVLLAAVGMAFVAVLSCGGDSGPTVVTYTGTDTADKSYTLKVTDNESYDLLIDGKSVSTGKVAKSGDVFTLTPNAEGPAFTVTVSGNKITAISGVITPDDGSAPITPGEIVQVEPVAGVWVWTMSDDSATNEWKNNDTDPDTNQSVFPPGGASRFSEYENGTDGSGNPVMKPKEYPAGSQKDNDGNTINTPVFNIKGNTKVSSDNRPANQGARFPVMGWEAVPDDAATLELLKTAYGYSFWVRLNSSTASNWSFLTAVTQTGLPIEEGWEYKHYFGNQTGDSGYGARSHFTGGLTLGKWHKISVVLDKTSPGFNLDQDGYIYRYNQERKRNFEQDKAEKLQWQIPLQHQVGASVSDRGAEPWDIIRGSYDFDFDFYGLELLK
jgi:hypothetical protein